MSITASLTSRLSGPSDQKAGIGGIRTKEEINAIMLVLALRATGEC